MAKKFKFMNLPYLPQEKILRHLNAFELMKFSLLSARTKNLAILQNRSFAYTGCLVNFLNSFELAILIDKNPGLKYDTTEMVPVFECRIPKLSDEPQQKWENTLSIPWTGPRSEASRMASFEKLVKHVRDVFPTREFYLNFSEPFDLRQSFFWKMQDPPKNLYFAIRANQKRRFSIENVRYALEELTLDSLMINGKVRAGCIFSRPLNAKTINLGSSHWLELESILKSTSEHIELFDSDSLSNREIRQVIDEWRRGGLRNWKTLTVKTEIQQANAIEKQKKLRKILSGIDTFPYSAVNRPASCESGVGKLNLEGALDFMGEDNTLASLDLSTRSGVHFVVWPKTTDS